MKRVDEIVEEVLNRHLENGPLTSEDVPGIVAEVRKISSEEFQAALKSLAERGTT